MPSPLPDGAQRVGRRRHSFRARLLLLACSSALVLTSVEIGFRLYWRLSGAPLSDLYGYGEEGWRRRWFELRRKPNRLTLAPSDEYHPKFGWKPRPNLRKFRNTRTSRVTTNSRGWRNSRDFPFAKPEGVKRMVLVGDSFTFGEEEEDEHIWPAVLQDFMPGWEVINLGVHGYGTDQQLLVLQDEGVRYRPDVVVVGFYVSDIYRNVLSFRDYAKPRFRLESGRLVLTNVPVPTPSELLARGGPGAPFSYAWAWMSRVTSLRQEKWDLTRAILAEIHATAEACGARTLVVIIPSIGGGLEDVREALLRWRKTIGYETLDLAAPLEEATSSGARLTHHIHFSELGHLLIARSLLRKLRAMDWVLPAELRDIEVLERRCKDLLPSSQTEGRSMPRSQ